MKRPKRLLKRFVIFCLLLAGFAAAFVAIDPLKPSTGNEIPYRTDKVTRGTIAELITATGTISPEEVVTVGTQVSGQITKLYVKLNDQVKTGQLLAEIDPSIPQTQLKQSKASLETAQLAYTLAQRDYERTKALVEKEYLPKVDLERALQTVVGSKNSLESAKIQVERDEVNLSYTKVTAPIDGVIIAQEAASGQTLASNFQTPSLFKIARDMSVMKIDMNVPESDISKIHVDMPVKFTVDAFPDREFDGTISSIDMNPNNQSGVVTYNVIVKLQNEDHALFPGMTANISITLSEVKDVLRVPSSALRFSPPEVQQGLIGRLRNNLRVFGGASDDAMPYEEMNGGGLHLYLWRNKALKQVAVEVGASDDLYTEITSSEIKEGDMVVTGLLVQED